MTESSDVNSSGTNDGVPDTRKDVVYKSPEGVPLHLDLYYPAAPLPDRGCPLVVYTHGGGWSKGNRTIGEEGLKRMLVDALNRAGFCLASVEYRLCTRDGRIVMRDCVEDAKDATRFLVKHAAAFRIDVGNIFAIGDSAGAHIALMNLLTPSHSFAGDPDLADVPYRMEAGVSWYGPSDFENVDLFRKPGEDVAKDRFGDRIVRGDETEREKLAVYREVSPVNYLQPDSPPVLMMQAELDPVMPIAHAEYMKAKARAAGAPVQVEIIPHRTHNWNPQDDLSLQPSLEEIVALTVDFFQKHSA